MNEFLNKMKKVYSVVRYCDYRKEVSLKVLRIYQNKEDAIAYATFLCTNEEEFELDESENKSESEYVIYHKPIFDKKEAYPSKLSKEEAYDMNNFWYCRIAVDETDYYF